MSRSLILAISCLLSREQLATIAPAARVERPGLKIGVAAVSITPFGPDRDWDGTITESGSAAFGK